MNDAPPIARREVLIRNIIVAKENNNNNNNSDLRYITARLMRGGGVLEMRGTTRAGWGTAKGYLLHE